MYASLLRLESILRAAPASFVLITCGIVSQLPAFVQNIPKRVFILQTKLKPSCSLIHIITKSVGQTKLCPVGLKCRQIEGSDQTTCRRVLIFFLPSTDPVPRNDLGCVKMKKKDDALLLMLMNLFKLLLNPKLKHHSPPLQSPLSLLHLFLLHVLSALLFPTSACFIPPPPPPRPVAGSSRALPPPPPPLSGSRPLLRDGDA